MEQTNKNCLYLQSSQDLLLSWAVKSNERTFKIYVFSFGLNQTTGICGAKNNLVQNHLHNVEITWVSRTILKLHSP